MTFTKGGTITLGGKTYNISQINSVYIGSVKRYSSGSIWGAWFIGGIAGLAILGSISSVGGDMAGFLWFAATVTAFITALMFTGMEDYAVFFDMSSGKVSAYSNRDKEKVEQIKEDIIKGLEEGYFPNYLHGRQ